MPDAPKQPEPVASAAYDGTLYAQAFDAARELAFVGGSDGGVYRFVWRPLEKESDKPRLELLWRGDSYVAALALVGESDRQLVVGCYDGSLTWLRLDGGQQVRRISEAHDGWVRDLAPIDGGRLASVGDDMRLNIWDAETGQRLLSRSGHAPETPQGYVSALYTVAASPCGGFLASGDRVGEIRVWDAQTGTIIQQFSSGDFYTFDPEKRDRSIGGVRRLRFSDDGERLAVSGIGQITNVDGFVGPSRLELWDWRKPERKAVFQDPHQAVLNDVLLDGDRLIGAGGGDGGGLIISWRVGEEKPLAKIKPKGHVHRLAWFADRKRVLAAGFEAVQIWNV